MANENDGPKLYATKPKKSQLKKATPAPNPTPTPPPMNPTPPPSGVPPPSQSFARRYKFVWPVLLTVNLAIGGYLFLRTNKKNKSDEDGEVTAANSTPTPAASTTGSATATTSVVESPTAPAPVVPFKVREPIPEETQRELLMWILEEKRKVKPNDPEEKKRLDEEKAMLKQFIKGKSIPSI